MRKSLESILVRVEEVMKGWKWEWVDRVSGTMCPLPFKKWYSDIYPSTENSLIISVGKYRFGLTCFRSSKKITFLLVRKRRPLGDEHWLRERLDFSRVGDIDADTVLRFVFSHIEEFWRKRSKEAMLKEELVSSIEAMGVKVSRKTKFDKGISIRIPGIERSIHIGINKNLTREFRVGVQLPGIKEAYAFIGLLVEVVRNRQAPSRLEVITNGIRRKDDSMQQV